MTIGAMREDRDRLRGDDPRHQACGRALRTWTISDGEHDAEQRAEAEAEQRRGERDPGVVDEAALGGAARVDRRLPELLRPPGAAPAAPAAPAPACRRRGLASRSRRLRPALGAGRSRERPAFSADRRPTIPERDDDARHDRAPAARSASERRRPIGALARDERAVGGGSASVVIGMPGPQALADAVGDGEELGRLADVERCGRAARSQSITSLDAARARRHHHDPRGQEHRLGDRVRDEHHRLARCGPRAAAAAR